MAHINYTRMSEDEARALLESIRWPSGPVCSKCGSTNAAKLGGKAGAKGQCKCRDCRRKFTIRTGWILEDSPLPLRDWVYCFARMCASKKGISAHQLHRELGVTYKTAWFMCHRVRESMRENGTLKLTGVVESDEAWIGGKPRKKNNLGPVARKGRQKTKKHPVHTLVERDGRKYTRVMQYRRVTASNLRRNINALVDKSGTLMTDEHKGYRTIGKEFKGGHQVVQHSTFEYARKDGAGINTAESSHALLKRGVYGTFHHISRKHMQRYLDEFDFRWNHRGTDDNTRTLAAIRAAEGKRLMYRVSAA